MTEDRNPESRMDLALNLISRRADPTAFRPAGGGMNPLQALEWLGREGIREPLSTAVSYASLSEADARAKRDGAPWWSRALSGLKEPVDWFNTDRWREASGIAQNRSLGQSVMLGALTSNIRDPAEVAAARESQWYRKGSGAVDAAARVTVDPNAVLGGQTIRTMIANTARRGGPAAAAGIRSAAGQNRLGLKSPGRWIGQVDPPDAPPGSFGVPGRTSTTPRFNTSQYLDEVRAARPASAVAHVDERYPTGVRGDREGVWRNAILRRAPVLEDGYVVPMEKTDVLDIINDVQTNISRPARGVLVQLDEAGQVVGQPLRAVGDTTPLDDIGLVGFDKPVSPNWITDSRRPGWWWVHADSAQPSSPHSQIIGLDDLETRAFKVAMTGDEVAASKVDDLLERFDSILPDDEWRTMKVPTTMKGGVFKGTAAEGKTLTEIGEMALNLGEIQRLDGLGFLTAADKLDLAAGFRQQGALSPAEAKAIWPTIRRMYADEAVDNILTARDDMDTMRLRALFYDDPSMASNQTYESAVMDYVNRGDRQGLGMGGLESWDAGVGSAVMQEIRELIVADLRAITRKFADDMDMPERVSVGRWQAPGEPIGASGSTFPMDPQWGGQMTTGNPANPMSPIYGTSGPGGMGGLSGHKWIEAVVDPRTDIDFFMLSRTGHNFAEHEILMSPAKWAEKAVGGLGDAVGEVAPSSMPGLTSPQIEFGPNAPKWMQRALDELEAAGTEPDLLNRYLTAPAGRTREALANRVRAEINVGRRNVLEADGWTNLPPSGAIRVLSQDAATHLVDEADKAVAAVNQIASGQYDAADWLRFGKTYTLPTPPNWHEFTAEVRNLVQPATRPLKGYDVGDLDRISAQQQSFVHWYLGGPGPLPGRLVEWTVKEGAPAGKATMELVPGWQDELKRLIPIWQSDVTVQSIPAKLP